MRQFPRVTAPNAVQGLRDARVLDSGGLAYAQRTTDGETTRLAGDWVFIEGQPTVSEPEDVLLSMRARLRANAAAKPAIEVLPIYGSTNYSGMPLEILSGSAEYVGSTGISWTSTPTNGPLFRPVVMEDPLIAPGLAGGYMLWSNGSASARGIVAMSYRQSARDWDVSDYRVKVDATSGLSDLTILPESNRVGAMHHLTPGIGKIWGGGYARPIPTSDFNEFFTFLTYPSYVTFERSKLKDYFPIPHDPTWGSVFPPLVARVSRTRLVALVFYAAVHQTDGSYSLRRPQLFWSNDNGVNWGVAGDWPFTESAALEYDGWIAWLLTFQTRAVPLTPTEALFVTWAPGPTTVVPATERTDRRIGDTTHIASYTVPSGPGTFQMLHVTAGGAGAPIGIPLSPAEYSFMDLEASRYMLPRGGRGFYTYPTPGSMHRSQLTGICRPAGAVVATFIPRWPRWRHMNYFPGYKNEAQVTYTVTADPIDPEPIPATPPTASMLVIYRQTLSGWELVTRPLPWHWKDTASKAFCWEDGIGVIADPASNGTYTLFKSLDLGLTWTRQFVVDRLSGPHVWCPPIPGSGKPPESDLEPEPDGGWPYMKYRPFDATATLLTPRYVSTPPWVVARLSDGEDDMKPYPGATWI